MFEIEGIVLKTTDFQDYDKMVTLISEESIISFLARGVLKYQSKNGPSVNEFSLGRYEITNSKNGSSLKRGSLINSYHIAKSNIVSLAILDFMQEITLKLVDKSDAIKVYPFLKKSLSLLNEGFNPVIVYLTYFAKALIASGIGLNVDSCVRTNSKEQIIAISYEDGGFVSKKAYNPLTDIKLTIKELMVIRYIFKVDIDNYGSVDFLKDEPLASIKHIMHILDSFLRYVNQTDLKSLALINKLI